VQDNKNKNFGAQKLIVGTFFAFYVSTTFLYVAYSQSVFARIKIGATEKLLFGPKCISIKNYAWWSVDDLLAGLIVFMYIMFVLIIKRILDINMVSFLTKTSICKCSLGQAMAT
jgi:hypothetical protein